MTSSLPNWGYLNQPIISNTASAIGGGYTVVQTPYGPITLGNPTYSPPPTVTYVPPATPNPTPVTPTIDPKLEANALYGKPMALSALGYARIGSSPAPIVGPYFNGPKVDFIVSFGVPANVEGDRKIYKIYLDNELAWSSDAGGTLPSHGTFAAEAFDFIFQPGTLTQPVCSLETEKFPGDECAYRPQMILQLRNLVWARFQEKTGKPVPYVALEIGDVTDGADPDEGINLGEALERVAYSPWCGYTPDSFESVNITDVVDAILIKDNFTIIDLCRSATREYRNIDLLVSDKIRVKDRGGSTAATLTVNRNSIIADANPIMVTRAGATAQKREHELLAIDPDQDYTMVPSLSKVPRDPMVISAAVGKETVTVPFVIDASTRQALATFSQNYEENARRKVALKVPVSGYRIEPGDLFVVVDMLEGFDNEVFKCTATSHGANWMVELEGEAILKCSIYRGAIPGNALFVSGDSMASVRWCHVDGTSTQEWHQNWLIDPFYSVGEIRASSYAKPGGVPTFVVGGNDFFFPVGMNACIATSHDGENWTTTYFSDTTYLVILNMVWDEADQAFYAHLDDFNPAHARCLRSPDGYTWTEHASTFWSHTEDGVTPDGKVGYDPDTGATIRPEDLDLSSIMYQVTCTAFADGIWMAGGKLNSSGHAATATSLDGGATWSLVSTGALEEGFNAHIWTMVAAPQSDFE